jgi:1-pyrroline-5-carboxylate dehydrogenase
MVAMVNDIKMGDVRDFRNFMGAVIDKRAFEKITGYIDYAREHATIVAGGTSDSSRGYFIRPTLIETSDPNFKTLREEIFGPVLTARLVDSTSPYALTGGVFAQDRRAVAEASSVLRYAAGNFYINDKPTGAVVGQQPFGGARASGTNDKAGSKLNLVRWVSARTIKENFNPPRQYPYPFMAEE